MFEGTNDRPNPEEAIRRMRFIKIHLCITEELTLYDKEITYDAADFTPS